MVPLVLYKYLESQYAEALVRDGTVRVGTLFSYRALEENDSERGDAEEGKLLLRSDSRSRTYNSNSELPAVLQHMSIECGVGGISTNGENAIRIESDGPDMFIYCLSETGTRITDREWGSACVKISDPRRFLEALDAAVRLQLGLRGQQIGIMQSDRCHYIDRCQNWHTRLPPSWLLKPARYANQREFRVGWNTDVGAGLESVTVKSQAIAAVCELRVLDKCEQ